MRKILEIGLSAMVVLAGLSAPAVAGCVDACIHPQAVAMQVAQNQSQKGIAARTPGTVRFVSGYRFKTQRRGKSLSIIANGGTTKLPDWEISCTCSGDGACFASQSSNNMVECVSHPGGCDGSCGMKLVALPPPPPPPS